MPARPGSAMIDVSARPRFLDGATLVELVDMGTAVATVEAALAGGLDPEADPVRTALDLPAGQLLFMPSVSDRYAGVKLVTVAPGNTGRGLPRVQGVYVLMAADTLRPVALLDGLALTALRTPAVSAVAVRHLAVPDARRLLVFGTGPQAYGHVEAVRRVRPVEHLDVVGRRANAVRDFIRHWRARGLAAEAASPAAVARADIVCCCTTAREPLFPGALVAPHAIVVAVGSHEPDAWELDAELVGRAMTVVEARSTALREAGDIIQAIRTGRCTPASLSTLAEVVRGAVTVPADRPRVFKSTGMAWQDLAVAVAAYQAWREREVHAS